MTSGPKMIDIHSHILPGLDDGAQDLEESIALAEAARNDGVTAIVATPHLFRRPSMIKDLNVIEKKWLELKKALAERSVNIALHRGAEVHIGHETVREIRKNRRFLTLYKSSYLLVEFPSHHVFPKVRDLFFEILNEKIIPIIAHPERNLVFTKNPETLYDLVEMGSLCQANAGSLMGYYGRTIRKHVLSLLRLNLIHFIASDCHFAGSKWPKLSDAVKMAETVLGKERAQELVGYNPQTVLEDRELYHLASPIDPNEKNLSHKVKIPNIFGFRK